MQKLFSPDSIVFRFLSRLGDLIVLSLLWLVCSLPVFTSPAATTALYAVMLRQASGDGAPVIRSFFARFRENFRQATLLWLLTLPVVALGIADLLLILGGAVENALMLALCLVPVVLLAMALGLLYPVIAYYRVTNVQALKNAALLTIARLPMAFLVLVVNCVPLILWLLLAGNIVFWLPYILLFGTGLLTWINTHLILRVFRSIPTDGGEEDA